MRNSYKYLLLFLIILFAGGLVRFIRPEMRPMHTDESVNAHKFGILLETGKFQYDKTEYHGPVLYYSTFVSALLKGHKTYSSLDESTLRMVPAFFGLLILVLLLLVVKELKWEYVLITGALIAVAPGLVFYSRYYIHESLLTFFSIALIISVFRYIQDRKLVWLVLAGAFIGFMHATKETCVINYAACAIALPVMIALGRGTGGMPGEKKPVICISHLLIVFFSAAIVSILFFSSFFSYPKGIIDSLATYGEYFKRAGIDDAHIHPWYFYLSMMFLPGVKDGFSTSEAWLLITSSAGLLFLMLKKSRGRSENLLVFIGLYSLILLLIYSVIPYKTPWNVLQFYPGLLFLSGYGIARFFRIRTVKWFRLVMLIILISGGIHWAWTSIQLNFRYNTAQWNPYVYSQTGTDVLEITREIDLISSAHPEGKKIPIEVIFPGNDYWPLPWYLRKYPNTGFYDQVNFDEPAAPILITNASVEKDLIRKLFDNPPPGKRYLYLHLSDACRELRPGIEIRTYVRKDVWDLYYIRQDLP